MDRRLVPSNARVAAAALKGQIEAPRYSEGAPRQVMVAVTDLLRAPDGPRDRQLVYGEVVSVFDEHQGWAFVQAERDGYVGYIDPSHLGEVIEATHIVAVPASHLYPVPELKCCEIMAVSFGTRLRVVSAAGEFFESAEGHFIPKPHLRPANRPFTDPASVAQLFFGAPYLWGGNSIWGLDCSGLIQAALLACGIACPGDSDLQEAVLGRALAPSETLLRGDLIFWKGHVAMAVDEETILHANAHTMSVAYERVEEAIARIAEQDGGAVTSRRRLG